MTRAIAWIPAACLALAACAEVPTAEELGDLESDTPWMERDVVPSGAGADRTRGHDFSHLEPPAPEFDHRTGPRIRVGRMSADEDVNDTALCPFTVEALGFPAVRADGKQVVTSVREVLSASEGEDETMTIGWQDIAIEGTSDEALVFDGDDAPYAEDDRRRCRQFRKRVVEQAREINARLREHAWRPMSPLAATIIDDQYGEEFDHTPILELAPNDRPVEFLWQANEAIFRIARVKVLARSAAMWRGGYDEFCDSKPHPQQLWGDRESGAVVVTYDHQSGGCLCYPPTEVGVFQVPDQVFEELEVRPSELVG